MLTQPADLPQGQGSVTAPDGRTIAYRMYGAGTPAVVLIHGWCCHQEFWHHQGESLKVPIVTLDLAGHGASGPRLAQGPSAIEAFARDVEAVARGLGLQDCVLVGHSLGGPVAVEAAIRMPERCRLVIGVDTFTDAAFYRRRPRPEILQRRADFTADFAGTMQAMVARITGPRTDAETRRWIGAAMADHDPAAALDVLEDLLAWDIEARWPRLPCPAETINAAMFLPLMERIDLHGLIVHLMPEVGHFPMLEDPAGFDALLGAILRRHGAG